MDLVLSMEFIPIWTLQPLRFRPLRMERHTPKTIFLPQRVRVTITIITMHSGLIMAHISGLGRACMRTKQQGGHKHESKKRRNGLGALWVVSCVS